MAIQVTLTAAQTNVGIACASAYARIVGIHHDSQTGKVEVSVNVYASRDQMDAGKVPVFGGVYSAKWYSNEITGQQSRGRPIDPVIDALPAVTGLNLPVLYTFLKTFPDFAAGADV